MILYRQRDIKLSRQFIYDTYRNYKLNNSLKIEKL